MSDREQTTAIEGHAYARCENGEIVLFVLGDGATEPMAIRLSSRAADALRCDLADAEDESNG